MNYAEYIVSDDWYNRCRRFFDDLPMCSVRACRRRYREGRVQIHHRTYVRLGNERRTDLVPLCDACHGDAHRWADYCLKDAGSKDAALRRGTEMVLSGGGSHELLAELRAADDAELVSRRSPSPRPSLRASA